MMWNDDLDFSAENYVSCPECGGFNIYIKTEAAHTSGDGSDGVQILDEHRYVAQNSDRSWSIVGQEIFHCSDFNCHFNWPVDRNTIWDWVE